MIIKVKHTTNYSYGETLNSSMQIIRLTPFNNSHQRVIEWKVKAPKKLHKYIGWFGNICNILEIDKKDKLSTITIEADGIVETFPTAINYEVGVIPLEFYLVQTNFTNVGELLARFIDESVRINQQLLDSKNYDEFFTSLSRDILQKVPYTKGVTSVDSNVNDAFSLGGGVCQDHTHIMLSVARYLNFPARYVSGYIHTTDTTHVESHAWAEVWYNNAWHSFDVSNQCQALENHIILAYGNDYSSASPIRGSRVGGGVETLSTNAFVMAQ